MTQKKLLWTTGEVAKLKNCTIDNVNKLIKRHYKVFKPHLTIISGGHKLLDVAGKNLALTMPDHRFKGLRKKSIITMGLKIE